MAVPKDDKGRFAHKTIQTLQRLYTYVSVSPTPSTTPLLRYYVIGKKNGKGAESKQELHCHSHETQNHAPQNRSPLIVVITK